MSMDADEGATASYDFPLPSALIAQTPSPSRDASRLMIVGPQHLEHRRFFELPSLLRRGDVLVLNDTKVIAARIFATRETTGGNVELLLLHPAGNERYNPHATVWTVLARPGKRLRCGARLNLGECGHGRIVREGAHGERDVEFTLTVPFERFLERAGRLPLPPYIRTDNDSVQQRYQTVFARAPGSVAAPTASLHFTSELLQRIAAEGVEIVYLTLQVGLGTFRPMSTARIDEHRMHAEAYDIPDATARAIRNARARERRIVAAGTTVVRALEGSAAVHGAVRAGAFSASLFIRPGFSFRVVDAMVTNFHLPRSTLLVLMSAFAGRERILAAYREAVRLRYRFFSFGDAMFVERAADLPFLGIAHS
jgi:S-adenosylmethionine:tRNA ribosyltransferase-isomerase